MKKVFVSGCFDLLHSGHVEFFRQASSFGDLYVGIGSDETILGYKHHKTVYSEEERLYMVKSIRYVEEAFINSGSGVLDFIPTLDIVNPDVLVVNEDGDCEEKRILCKERGMDYIVLDRVPSKGLRARSSTDLKNDACEIPLRLDLAGTWIDQTYVSCYGGGWAITMSLEPTFKILERSGLATSTRNTIRKIWPFQLPNIDPEMLARLVFCLENEPERENGFIAWAQDAIGICVPGVSRHYYNNRFWPEKIEVCRDDMVLNWLEDHICMIPMFPRKSGFSVLENRNVSETKVRSLTLASERCWSSMLSLDLYAFASAFQASFEAQISMFPAMMQPGVQPFIDRYSSNPEVLAWKMTGSGGGGYLVLVCSKPDAFPEEAIRLSIRR